MINIRMVDINYAKAGINIREKFAFTRAGSKECIINVRQIPHVMGCLILSTCNRTQLWISHDGKFDEDMCEILCSVKGLPASYDEGHVYYREYFDMYEGADAVLYLYELAAGLKSQIMGEDQIITQVTEALNLARENMCTDRTLEVLFRMAVTSAKKVKTKFTIPKSNSSAPGAAISSLTDMGYNFAEKKCLVIGNGVMGRLTAQRLLDEGAHVTVTVRQYKSGIVDIPRQAERIDYGERYEYIPECDYIFSATASPNMTLKEEKFAVLGGKPNGLKKGLVLVDLAVPRDIDTAIGTMEDVKLYDIDSFHIDMVSDEMIRAVDDVKDILRQDVLDFFNWYEAKDVIPAALEIGRMAALDVSARVKGQSGTDDKEEIYEIMEGAVKKTVSKMLFGIRDIAGADSFRECVAALGKLYQTDGEDASNECD